jgi:proteasome lid subunit RPN8/RPN11
VRPRILHCSSDLTDTILRAALRAFPQECCGLIEGIDCEDGWRAIRLHETANLAEDPSRYFLVDPQAQFDLMRVLRGGGRRILGCFHSHPNGRAEPSATDLAQAYESNFLYLIAGGEPERGFALHAYVRDHSSESFSKVEIAR